VVALGFPGRVEFRIKNCKNDSGTPRQEHSVTRDTHAHHSHGHDFEQIGGNLNPGIFVLENPALEPHFSTHAKND